MEAMEAGLPGFLDETAYSQTVKSPVKTSTAAKENIKWDENVFFKRQDIVQASESLFIHPAESPIAASNKQVKTKESLQAPKLNFNDCSLVSERTNSSLGILNVENLSDLSDSSFRSAEIPRKRKSKKKLQRNSRLPLEDDDPSLKFEEGRNSAGGVLQQIFIDTEKVKTVEEKESGSNSSSDIEFDGTNIPELNLDYDFLSGVHSDQAHSVHNSEEESGIVKSVTITNKESDFSGSNGRCSWMTEDMTQKSDSCSRENSVNMRQSIFENFQSPLDSLYDQLLPDKKSSTSSKYVKAPKTIRVCPFLDVSSFEVEPILQNSSETTSSSGIENARYSQNISVDFCPEQISARSSSFKSSLKYDPSGSEISNTFNKEDISAHPVMNTPRNLFEEGDLGDEGFKKFGDLKFDKSKELVSEKYGICDKRDSSLSINCVDSATFTANGFENITGFSDSPFQSALSQNLSGLVDDAENVLNHLGLSDSDFFSSEAAKELLQKDKEAFEKEQKFESVYSNKMSGASNWSPPDKLEVTAPSWLLEHDTHLKLGPDRHISFGTLISARSENVGSLSEDENRERPYFGTTVRTPPKPSDDDLPADGKSQVPEDFCKRNFRVSGLSDFLDNITATDPENFASEIVEKYISKKTYDSEKEVSIHTENKLKNKFDLSNETFKISDKKALSDIEECESTLTRSASDSSINKVIDNDANLECRSTTRKSVDSYLNYSVGSSCETASVKTVKNDTFSESNQPSSQPSETQEFSRPPSSCSSACSHSLPQGNAVSLHYGCMRYLNAAVEHNQNGITNLLQPSNSAFPCSHVCAQHAMLPNFFSSAPSNLVPSVIQNPISGQLIVSGSSVSFAGIQVPSELYFPDKIACGDSQEMTLSVRNFSNVPCYYQVSCVSAYLNDSPLPSEMSGLSYNKTISCSTGNSTDIKLILAPKYEGKIEVNLQIDVFLNSVGQTLNATPSATAKTKIQYEAVHPSVSILYKGKDSFNLGSIIAGSTFVEHVSIVNNCEVSVPLRISLSNESSDNQVYFGLKELGRQKHSVSGTLRVLSPQVILYRLPSSKNKQVPATLDIPVVFESVNGFLNSSITAAVETPTFSEVLAFIKISATVGTARLMLKDCNQNPLILKAARGAMSSHSVTVINDGTLPVVYDIHIESDTDVFSVSPNSLHLKPKQCATLSVNFTPQEYCTSKGKLLAAAQPHGQVFDIVEVVGCMKENYSFEPRNAFPQIHSTRPTRDSADSAAQSSSLVEFDKRYLTWGGVEIDKNEYKNFTLRNPKQEHVQVKFFIKESEGFMLLNENNQKKTRYQLTLKAKEDRTISVIFSPKNVISYSGLLCIRAAAENERTYTYTLPLSGYGGTSSINVLDLPKDVGNGYCLNVNTPFKEEVVHKNIVLHNTGVRPAFVKLLITYDGLVQNVISKQSRINPSEFILLENEMKNITVSINCINQNQISYNEIISIIYGDEILRQNLRKNLKSGASTNVYNINFNIPYHGEDKVPYDSSYKSSPKDESLFCTSIKKIPIHIYVDGQNTSFSRMSFGALSEVQENLSNLTLDSTVSPSSNLSSKFRRLTIEGHSPPVKDSAARNMNRLSLPNPFDCDIFNERGSTDLSSLTGELKNLKLDIWSVYPEELNVDTDNKDKRISMKNHSNSDLRFKLEWTIDVITISPSSGILPANGEIGLRLSLIMNNHTKLLEDYQGSIKICCGGTEKVVSVKVFRDNKKTRSTSPRPFIFNDSVRSGFLGESDFLESTVLECTSQSLNIENIFNFPKEINLCTTKTGVLSVLNLIVNNPTIYNLSWEIRPLPVLFSEPADDSISSTNSPIEFSTSNGVLKSKTTDTISIKFLPQSAARFQQFFELILEYGKGQRESCNIKVQGESLADFSVTNRPCDERDKKKQNGKIRKKAKSEIFTEKDAYNFPDMASGQKSTEHIIIKNISSQDQKISIIKPKSPFIVNMSECTVKSMKFLRLPVHFKPQKPGNFKSEIKFLVENGNELKVKLNGLCLT